MSRARIALAVAGAVGLAALVLILARSSSGDGDVPAAPPAFAPDAHAVAPSHGPPGRWVLGRTDCLADLVPDRFEMTQDGTRLTRRADGFADTVGTIDADGRYHLRNAFGSCTGRMVGKTSTEICTNRLHLTCRATYHQAD